MSFEFTLLDALQALRCISLQEYDGEAAGEG